MPPISAVPTLSGTTSHLSRPVAAGQVVVRGALWVRSLEVAEAAVVAA